MRLVIDTNVLVSALLNPGRVPDRALTLVCSQRCTVLYDARIAEEYRSVLSRPKFSSIPRERVDALLAGVWAVGQALGDVAPWAGELPDADDRPFVEVARAGNAHALVTGNVRHFPPGLGVDVLTPAHLLQRLGGV